MFCLFVCLFVDCTMCILFIGIKSFPVQKSSVDNSLLVRALDRFHRRLQAVDRLLPELKIMERGLSIVSRTAKDRVTFYSERLKQHFAGNFMIVTKYRKNGLVFDPV